jgi:pimeloyl-ACP methyl ester carboxylesterase
VTLEEAVSAVSLYMLGPFWTLAIDPDYALARQYSLDRLDRDARRALYGRMGPESGRALWETLNWWLDPFFSTQVAASRVTAPCLALAGGRDMIHPPATVRQTAGRLGGKVVEFSEMSHWLIGEPGYEDVARAALDWIDGL